MKKITFALCLLFFTLYSRAQLQSGTTALDFTITDINGTPHSLSSYLNSGKTVILEFSGVACGPSWRYLKTESLSDFYNAYGSLGSNEVVVLFLEDSNYTTLAELQGVSNPPAFGNWVEGTPFPILLDPNVHELYSINAVPTIYRICPDGILNLLNQPTASVYRNGVNGDCGTLTGVQNHVKLLNNKNGFCTTSGSFSTKLKNYGTNNVTSATLRLKENGTVVSTKSFTGNISQFATEIITFNPISINASATYTVELQNVNGATNRNPAFSNADLPFHISNVSGKNLDISIHTYSCPNNMSWEITNSSGGIVASGGPYEGFQGNCGGPNSNTILEESIVLPNSSDCYTLSLMDSNGYGWKNYYGNSPTNITPGIEISSDGNIIYSNLNVGNFGSILTVENFLTTDALGNLEQETSNFTISPNPSSGIVYVNSAMPVKLTIYDIMGKMVFSSEGIDINSTIDLSQLGKGIYIAKATGIDNKEMVKKLVLN